MTVAMKLSDYLSSFVVHCAGILLASAGLEIPGGDVQSIIDEVKEHRVFLIYDRQYNFGTTPEEMALGFCRMNMQRAQKNPSAEYILGMVKKGVNEFLDDLAWTVNEDIKKKNNAAE